MRRNNLDIRGALFTSIGAVVLAPIGLLAATAISAQVGNILFSVLIIVMAARMLVAHLRDPNKDAR
jgi:uncharacterized membrane protein YfcA